jgi:fibronectin-binding autotransporter adhesin
VKPQRVFFLLLVFCFWATSASARINTSKANGLWSSALTWSAGAPLATDTIVIRSTDIVTFNVTGLGATCNALTVNGTLKIGFIAVATLLKVSNDITVAAGGKIQANTNATHTLFVSGNIINNGSIDLSLTAVKVCNITFNKNGNASLSGTGILNHYNLITLNMGASINNTLTVSSSKFTTRAAATPFLIMVNGTFNFTSPAAGPFLLFTGNTTLTASCGITLNNATTTFNTSAGSLTLLGKLSLTAGTLNIGTVADNDLIMNGGGLQITGGTMNLAGKFHELNAASTATFSMSAGTFTLPTVTPLVTGTAPFQLSNATSSFTMTGGALVIQQNGGGANLGFINSNTSGIISGGNVQFGNTEHFLALS